MVSQKRKLDGKINKKKVYCIFYFILIELEPGKRLEFYQ
jgi:hypothetical protein